MRGGVRWFPRCRRALCVWRKGRPAQPFRSLVTSEHGFSDAVEITLSSLPFQQRAGWIVSERLVASESTPLVACAEIANWPVVAPESAPNNAATGCPGDTEKGLAGFVANALVPKSSFVRTDSVKGIDAPASEPHRRHTVYDAAGKGFFVANGAMNRVDVLSPSSAAPLASIDVPGASSVDLSPDGATLWVGSLPGWVPSLDTAATTAALIFATHTTDACCCGCSFPSRSRWSTDVDGLHGNFLTSDEFGQRLFAVTTSGLTIVQLANVPLGIGSIAPASGTAPGGASVTIRGSGFQSRPKAALGGKQASVTFQGYEYPQYCYPRALARSPTACSNQSRWRIRRSQRRFFRAIISPNHSLARFILVCENSMREGQCRHENSAIPI
jgi:hypothetical protein